MIGEIVGNVVKGAIALGLGLVGIATLITGAMFVGANWVVGLLGLGIGFGMLFAAQKLMS